MYVFTLTVAVFILPAIFAASNKCPSKGQCTALDGVTCVAPGNTRLEKCVTYTCKKSNNVFKYKVVRSLLKCERPDGTCMERGVGENNEAKCTKEICRQQRNNDGTFTMKYQERAYGCPLDDGTCLLFGRQNKLRNQDKCTDTTCRRSTNKKGQVITKLKQKYYVSQDCNGNSDNEWELILFNLVDHQPTTNSHYDRYHGMIYNDVSVRCPHDGICEEADETRISKCTTYVCVLEKRRTLMKWGIVKTGCETDEGCKYDKDEWPDLDADSCVTRRCDVTFNKADATYTNVNNIAKHGCRAANGSCYYDGETWPQDDCYTRRCDIGVADDGKSVASTNIESGICRDADGTCKQYGEAMQYRSGSDTLNCVCEEVTSDQGYPQGQPVCSIP